MSNTQNQLNQAFLDKLDNQESEESLLQWLSQHSNMLNPNLEYKKDSVLNKAARAGYSKLATELISLGADVNTQNSYGHTPLQQACSHGDLNLVKLLVKNNAKLNYTEGFHSSLEGPLDMSIYQYFNSSSLELKNKHLKVINYFLSLATREDKTDFFLSCLEESVKRSPARLNIFSDPHISYLQQQLLEKKDMFREKRNLYSRLKSTPSQNPSPLAKAAMA